MSAEQRGHAASRLFENGPYGGVACDVGETAFFLFMNLEAAGHKMPFAPDETPRWDSADYEAFEHLDSYDSGIALMQLGSEIPTDDLQTLFRNFRHLGAALPFSEGERHWLFEANRSLRPLGIDLVEGIIAADTHVISGGLRQVLRGRELVRRWAAWRRQADEFGEPNGRNLIEATHTLRLIGEQLVPRPLWPSGYEPLK
jgi:hypothetical protein